LSNVPSPIEERGGHEGRHLQVVADDDRGASRRRPDEHNPAAPACEVEDAHPERCEQKDERTHPRQEQVVGEADDGPHGAVEQRHPPPLVADEPGQQKRRKQVEDPGDLQFAEPRDRANLERDLIESLIQARQDDANGELQNCKRGHDPRRFEQT
jgi:hypothetical protein